jgi:AcrR family transcriptional regulator
VQKGNFYYYFRSKDELGMAVLRENLQDAAKQWLAELLAGERDPWAALQKLPRRMAKSVSSSDSLLVVVTQLAQELCRGGSEFNLRASDVMRELSGVLTEKLEQLRAEGRLAAGAQPVQLGEYLFSTIEGALFRHGLNRDREQLEATLRLALAGIAPLVSADRA